MALARPGPGRAGGRGLGRLLPAAAFGLVCFMLGTRLSPAAKQSVKHGTRAADDCRALLQVEGHAKAAEAAGAAGVDLSLGAQALNTKQLTGSASTAAAASAAGSTAIAAASPYDVPINVARLLGETGTAAGVLYTPYMCLPPWSQGIGDAALLRELRHKLTSALVDWLRPLAPAGTDDAKLRGTPLFPLLGIKGVEDPLFAQINVQLSDLLSRYFLHATGSRLCMCGAQATASAEARVKSADEVGMTGCPEGRDEPENPGFSCSGSMLGLLGYTGPTWSVDTLVEEVAAKGVCSSLVTEPTFGLWWIRERLRKPEYRAFKVDQPDEDTLLELFDLLYEVKRVFLRQKWLGFPAMQNGFDLLAIQDIIVEVRPDVIVETGTAAGGSTILWASILELLELHHSRIHTIDTTGPASGFGADRDRPDPTKHRLWAKYATFHKGSSTDPAVQVAVAAAAANASRVLVLLDSDHSAQNVAQELDLYCKALVTVGSYCVVEDTKMTRMGPLPGPLDAVKEFLAREGPQRWVADRDRELLYSHHPGGYLKRLS